MRPSILHIGGTIYWTLFTRNPDTMVLKDADSTPTVAVRKNGASVGDSVTITKRSATTGIYDCSYNPAAEVEGDVFTLEESATVTGTTTAQATYVSSFNVRVLAVERGTDGANTTAPATPTDVTDARDAVLAKLPAALVGGRMDASVGAMANNTLTAAALDADAVAEIQSGLATAANQVIIIDGIGFVLAQEVGSVADAQTAAAVYVRSFNNSTYTITHSGLTSAGVRGTASLVKS